MAQTQKNERLENQKFDMRTLPDVPKYLVLKNGNGRVEADLNMLNSTDIGSRFYTSKTSPIFLDVTLEAARNLHSLLETHSAVELRGVTGVSPWMSCPGLQDSQETNNIALFLAIYLTLYMNKTPEESIATLKSAKYPVDNLIYINDIATYMKPSFTLYAIDVVNGINQAISRGLLKRDDDLRFSTVSYGTTRDWIFPGKILACSTPVDKERREGLMYTYSFYSNDYFDVNDLKRYLKQQQVGHVVRLCTPYYFDATFVNNDIAVHDLEFPDGSVPSSAIMNKFFRICDEIFVKGESVVVHCEMGWGRTGTVIAAYTMRTWGFSAREAIGYLRCARSESVRDVQQAFLEIIENDLKACGSTGFLQGEVISMEALDKKFPMLPSWYR